ncbi:MULTISPECIES: DUF2461 domain-containing protein [Enterococcus]|uniref:DUF2461 domain-containing protein n=1 Tax=Candidatus Enterococcus murrayae TaxID=2815321 RepID=A0ABS3HG25_9ENTE|nr:DUF2461 domain-containing protein [Enterococcus sp. MJM16]MBO0452391.1 DUF2461 domain-containing protein [Enterococcus sp. MJM16]
MTYEKMFDYLSNLEKNNNRDWFHETKQERTTVIEAFNQLVDALSQALHEKDPEIPLIPAKNLTFKLNRDTRFSHDKAPYNSVLRAHIGPKGKLPIPCGYFLFLKPNNQSFLGGGLFADMFSEATELIRQALLEREAEFLSIIENPTFKKYYRVMGKQLKRMPRGYEAYADSPVAEFLKYKSMYLELSLTDQEILTSDNFITETVEKFLLMKEFNQFLNTALVDFHFPERK